MHIFLGSANPVKINALIIAATETWPEATVNGMEVESGVSNQPLTDDETRQGAENRARKAFEQGQQLNSDGDGIGVGMEGGVFENAQGELWNTVWVCIMDSSGKTVCANGARFLLPESLAQLIRQGREVGPAMDELVGTTNVKHKQGMIGIITKGFIDRTEMYANLAKLALGLWYGRKWEVK